MKEWTSWAALVPPLAVGITWWIGQVIYDRAVASGGPLSALKTRIEALGLQSDAAVRQANEMAARFAWHPTVVALFAVALGTIAACWYLIHHSLRDAARAEVPAALWNGVIAIAAGEGTMRVWDWNPEWLLRTQVLTPLLDEALGTNNHTSEIAALVTRSAQALTAVAACFVVVAAAAALLTPRIDPSEDPVGENTRKLPDQWRRLTFTLYAGAALLVTAVVHHTSLAGWSAAYVSAMRETERDSIRARVDTLANANALLALAKAQFERDSLTATVKRTTPRRDSLRKASRDQAARVDSLTYAIALDTMAAAARIQRADSTMAHVDRLTTAATKSGGGLFYSLLLALAYLPAALILMERAKELSEVAKPDTDNADRADWRRKRGSWPASQAAPTCAQPRNWPPGPRWLASES